MSRWLLTGADGQLARSVLEVARELGVEVHAYKHEKLDIADAEALATAIDAARPDVVLNCAAFTDVDLCEERSEQAERVNELGPRLLADACKGGPLLVHVSTDYVFSGVSASPLDEDASPGPLSVYGRTKLAGECAVRASGAEHLIVRSQWLFGPGPNFVRTILAKAAESTELRVVDDQIGRPTWTYLLAKGIFQAVRHGARGNLHVACEGEASWYDLAREAVKEGVRQRLLESEVAVVPISTREMPRPAARPARSVLDLERARGLGVVLAHWREGLRGYLSRKADHKHA